MLIINADDYGRSRAETDAAVACFEAGRITSATAMVFMDDSERAAEIAGSVAMDVGLHLNLSQIFTGSRVSPRLRESHERVVRFLTRNPYSVLLYNPALRRPFRHVYEAQLQEFTRLYGRRPSHLDGHQHRHLCANVLIDGIIPRNERVRRNFSFWPGEKSALNRSYRSLIDRFLARRYTVTDFFFSLNQCLQADRVSRVFDLSHRATVELMTHPLNSGEYDYLMSDTYAGALRQLETGTYSAL
jgi:chitin disaccharide deacetylase